MTGLRTRAIICIAFSFATGEIAHACGGDWDVACNFGQTFEKARQDVGHTVEKAAQDFGHGVEKAAHDVGNAGEKAAHDVGNAAERAAQDTGKATEKAAHDTGATIEKAAHDTGASIEKAFHDVGFALEKAGQDTGRTVEKAGHDAWTTADKAAADTISTVAVIGRFAENQLHGLGDAAQQAIYRANDGKIIDAFWHLATDQVENTEQNSFQAVKESQLLRAVAQVAASAYGGPAGAAAFAAWYTYRETGSIDLAVRAGVIAGASNAAFKSVSELPNDANHVVAKSIIAGTVGGLAVAAAGGDEDAVKNGFLSAGGMVLMQAGYEAYTDHPLDGHAAELPPYCKDVPLAVSPVPDCAPPISAYYVDNKDGAVKLDVSKLASRASHVGISNPPEDPRFFGLTENSGFMQGVAKVPGMNAMALFHDKWAMTWNLEGAALVTTIVPAVALTYVGLGSPFYAKLLEASIREPVVRDAGVKPISISESTAAVVDTFDVGDSGERLEIDGVILIGPKVIRPEVTIQIGDRFIPL